MLRADRGCGLGGGALAVDIKELNLTQWAPVTTREPGGGGWGKAGERVLGLGWGWGAREQPRGQHFAAGNTEDS